jgi:hypothetical protein
MRVASGDPMALALCKRIDSFIAKPPLPLPMATRAAAQASGSRSVSETAVALAPAPTRRYLALVRWDHSLRADLQWHFEEAVYDRQEQRWIWHAARGYDVSTHRDWRERSEIETLTSYLVHDLPSDLLNRGWWRSDLPVPDSRWVPQAEIAGWQPGARAALALANTYAGSMPLSEYRRLEIRPVDAADEPDVRPTDPSQRRPRQRAQRTPLLPPATHALLDLPPGDYLVRVYDEAPERISLAPGQTRVINIHRAAAFTGTARTFEDAAWWQARLLGPRSRPALLAEPFSRGAADLVPYFLTP